MGVNVDDEHHVVVHCDDDDGVEVFLLVLDAKSKNIKILYDVINLHKIKYIINVIQNIINVKFKEFIRQNWFIRYFQRSKKIIKWETII